MTGSAGIVVEVVVDAAALVDVAAVEVVAAVVAGTVDSAVGVVNAVDSLLLPLLQAVTASAATMNVVIDLVYFTGLSAVQKRSSSGGLYRFHV